MKSPVLLIAFNRPAVTQQVFNAIKSAKPKQLFIAVDAPRSGNNEDFKKTQAVKEIANQVDWDCEVKTFFQDNNLGCSKGPSTAISWFFENVEQGIILEDDCLPSSSFFAFCDEMLDKYKDDDRIMLITGSNFVKDEVDKYSYHFSKLPITWGWASWRSEWSKFDLNISSYSQFRKDKRFNDVFQNELMRWYWLKMLDRVNSGAIKTAWDYQWFYALWSNNGLSIVPNINLIQNIGFDCDATHTNYNIESYSLQSTEIKELSHPLFILQNNKADKKVFENFFNVNLSKSKILFKKLFDKKFKDYSC